MSTVNYEKLTRVTVMINRKKGITEDEFNKYWAYKHGPLATEWLLRCGIVKYTQVNHLNQADETAHQRKMDADFVRLSSTIPQASSRYLARRCRRQ